MAIQKTMLVLTSFLLFASCRFFDLISPLKYLV